jgi:tRNA threonylcarbamoyladenosine biosynthesis protein TsaB
MNERVLLIDTSSMLGLCAVAQKKSSGGWDILFEQYINAESSHSEHLFMGIQDALSSVNIKFADLSSVIYCAGPGSFTGLRISYSAVKGFMLAQGIKSAGVSTLRAMIYNLKDSASKYRAALIKGSGTEVFAFAVAKNGEILLEEGSYDIAHVLGTFKSVDDKITCIGSGARYYTNDLETIGTVTIPANIEQDRVTPLGMLSLLEDSAIDGINYLKASYAEKRR